MANRFCGRKATDPHKIRRSLSMELMLVGSQLPPKPSAVNWLTKMTAPLGMMLNDEEGDCTIATQGHAIQVLTANASTQFTPPDADIQATYVAVTGAEGAAFNPVTKANDNGCQLSDVIDYVIANGLSGHKYQAKLSLNPKNPASLEYALFLFGNLQLGVSLTPQSLQATDTFDIPRRPGPFHRREYTPDPSLGHAIAAGGFNADGSIDVMSWGSVFTATAAWLSACVDEAWVVLPNDWLTANNIAPNMIDWPTLQKYYPAIVNA